MPKSAPFLLVILLAVLGLIVYSSRSQFQSQVLAAQTSRDSEIAELKSEAKYWERLVNNTPTYRDGYLQLSTIYYRLGEETVSKYWLQRALDVDPNYILPSTLSFLVPWLPVQ